MLNGKHNVPVSALFPWVTIEKMLDRGLPETYTRKLFQQKTEAIFQHIYESYYGGGRGIYVAVTQNRAIS